MTEEDELSPYLSGIINPFPRSSEVLSDLKELCIQAKEINESKKINEKEFGSYKNPKCWDDCTEILATLNQLETAQNLCAKNTRTNTPAVTIGTRRMQKGTVRPLNFQTMNEVSEKIEKYITGTSLTDEKKPIQGSTFNSLSEVQRNQFRSRSHTTTEIPTKNNNDFGIFQLKALETREGARKKHLSIQIDLLVDDCPQQKLIRVFTKNQRTKRKLSNPWQQYITSISLEGENKISQTKTAEDDLDIPYVPQSARKSIRYGDRNTMNTFLKKRKSLVAGRPVISSKENLQAIFERLPNPPSLPDGIITENTENIQKSAPRTIEFHRKQQQQQQQSKDNKQDINNNDNVNNDNNNNQKVLKVEPVKIFDPSLENLPDRPITSSPSLRRRLTLNCKPKDNEKLQKIISDEKNKKIEPKIKPLEEEPLFKDVTDITVVRNNIARVRTRGTTTISGEQGDPDSWRTQLRSAWDEEITSMPSTKRAWFKKEPSEFMGTLRRTGRKASEKDLRSKEKVCIFLSFLSSFFFFWF